MSIAVNQKESTFLGGNRLLETKYHFFFQVKMMQKKKKPGKGREHYEKGTVDEEGGAFKENGYGRPLWTKN